MPRLATRLTLAAALIAGAAVLAGFGLDAARAPRPSAPTEAPLVQASAPSAPASAARASAAIPARCPANPTLTLAGTALVDGGHRVALLRTADTSRLLAPGQSVAGHTVRTIARRQVVVEKDAVQTCVRRTPGEAAPPSAAPAGPIRALGGGQFQVERAWMQARLADLPGLGREIRMAPVREGGRLAGFRVARLRAGGPFERLGLRTGDVLTAANGQALDSPNAILGLYSRLPESDVVRVQIRRGGTPQTLDYLLR